jgi:hypothetical protein
MVKKKMTILSLQRTGWRATTLRNLFNALLLASMNSLLAVKISIINT